MFGLLESLTKAAVAVAVTPIDLAIDVVTLPASSMDPHRGPFERTGKRLEQVAQNVNDAVAPR